MQHSDPDPGKLSQPHGLDDLLDHVNTQFPWRPSWDDVCRVRAYVGDRWPKAHGNHYDLASIVLHDLADVDRARAAIAPYMTIACAIHGAAIGVPCAHRPGGWAMIGVDLQLPLAPVICAWRVLSRHDRLTAMEIFERRPPALATTARGRHILPISAELPGAMTTARVQYRHPGPLAVDRVVVSSASDWTIRDIRIEGASVLAPHLDLPGALFSNDLLGPRPLLPILEQDQWIEIEARCIRGDAPRAPWFRACLIGHIEDAPQKGKIMNRPDDTDPFKKFQEQREQRAAEHLAACERLRRKLELPIEALALIDRVLQSDPVFGDPRIPRSVKSMASMATRAPLRLQSEKKIQPTDPITGRPTPVHVRPQTAAMRVEEIEILSEPSHWMIADVQVSMRSQFPQAGPPLPGRLFTPGGTCHHFVTETIQTAMDFTLLVHYVGPAAAGDLFEAVAMGSLLL